MRIQPSLRDRFFISWKHNVLFSICELKAYSFEMHVRCALLYVCEMFMSCTFILLIAYLRQLILPPVSLVNGAFNH